MAPKQAFRIVGPDEKTPRKRALTVSQAAKRGTPRELLIATRDRLAIAVEDMNTPSRDLAPLTKRLMETVREIEAIDSRERAEVGADGVPDGSFDASAI